jgi:hypothetical protein
MHSTKISLLTEQARNIETKDSSLNRDVLENLYSCHMLKLNNSLLW